MWGTVKCPLYPECYRGKCYNFDSFHIEPTRLTVGSMGIIDPEPVLSSGDGVDQRALGCLPIPDINATFWCGSSQATWMDAATGQPEFILKKVGRCWEIVSDPPAWKKVMKMEKLVALLSSIHARYVKLTVCLCLSLQRYIRNLMPLDR